MAGVSNKTIVALLAVALVVTVAGTLVSVSKLNQLSYPTLRVSSYGLTGAPSASIGEANLTIQQIVSLSVSSGGSTGNTTPMSFGSGAINQTCLYCFMDSNGVNGSMYVNGTNGYTGSTNPSNWGISAGAGNCCRYSGSIAFSGPGNNGFLLENSGNVNISVGYTCSGNCTYATFTGGSRAGRFGGLEMKVTSNSDAGQTGEEGEVDALSSCNGGSIVYGTTSWNATNFSTGDGGGRSCNGVTATQSNVGIGRNGNCTGFPVGQYFSITREGHWLCGNATAYPLSSDALQDAAVVDINVTIAADAPASGVRSAFRLTFNGTASG